MSPPTLLQIARVLVACIAGALMLHALQLLTLPGIYQRSALYGAALHTEAYAFLGAAVILAVYYRALTAWLAGKMHDTTRLLSGAALSVLLMADGLMHALNIPHLEGWWIPLLGGSGAASWLLAKLAMLRKKP